MIPTLDSMLKDILRREGGYTNHPNDRGGPTNFGITQASLSSWRRRPVTPEEVRDMPESEAKAIYQSRYLTEPGLHRIQDPYVLSLAFDCAVNHGPHRAIHWLQQCVGVIDDGIFGDQTEVQVNTTDPVRLYNRLLAKRIRFYGEIVTNNPSQCVFAKGWLARAAEFLET